MDELESVIRYIYIYLLEKTINKCIAMLDPAKLSYGSVIGMILYLASNTKPDISFAVN